MKRLDEIKVRLNNAETVTDEGVLLDSVIVSHAAADVAVLVAAIEAVLELGREANAAFTELVQLGQEIEGN